MKRLLTLFTTLLLGGSLHAFGAGLIILHEPDFWQPRPPHWPQPVPPRIRPPAWQPIELSSIKADVRIRDQIATTTVDEEFYNPNARQLEGTFLFPVPKGAHIDKFTMEINGKPVEAELLTADKARGIYENIVRNLRDPALLEYAGRDLFKVRIFPIEPNARKRISLALTQLLKSDGGLVNYTLPLGGDKTAAKPVNSVSVKVDLESKHPLKAIYSPSHKVEVKRNGDLRATVGFETSGLTPDADFQLLFSRDDSALGLSLLTYKTDGEDGYFLLLASPAQDNKTVKVIPKDVAFVLDTSGSMAGNKLEQARKALAFCVENLNEGDRFEVLRFATEVEGLFDTLTDATSANRKRAQDFIKELKPIGGTAIDDALRKALALRPATGDRPFVIVFLTDGRPTVGTTDEQQIVGNVTKANQANTRVFCFGIGTDVNTHLLDKITEETKAFSQYVLPDEDLEVKVSSFFIKIKEPVLANPKLTFPADVRVTKLYPSPVPDLFKGEQIVLAGRYAGKGDGVVTLEGSVGGETRKFAFDVKFSEEARDHEFIPRLWATRRVGYLLDEIRLRGDNKELKDEVTELARKYGIVTPYTAYLIVEDEKQRGVAQAQQTMRFYSVDGLARRSLSTSYEGATRDRGGVAGVSGANSLLRLKMAESASEAIVAGNADAYLSTPAVLAPPTAALSSPTQLGREVSRRDTAKAFADQGRYVGGRTFFLNNEQWTDSDVQKKPNAQRVRVQFGSDEYFALLAKQPQASGWLALGRNVQFVLGDTIFEIYE